MKIVCLETETVSLTGGIIVFITQMVQRLYNICDYHHHIASTVPSNLVQHIKIFNLSREITLGDK